MSLGILSQIRNAMHNLNPEDVRSEATRPLNIGLVAPTTEGHWRMERWLCPPELTPSRRAGVARMLHRVGAGERNRHYDFEIWDESLAVPEWAFGFDPSNPGRSVEAVLDRHPELTLPLARFIQPFRKPAIDRLISKVARENALFSLATALPDILPSLISLPWAITEFASDTAFLTGNQIRMAFLIAAASDQEVGYREQKGPIGSIVAGAFGLRAIARELSGKIPFGGGLIPKAAVSYAGTYVIGRSMERYYSTGYGYSREERRSAFEQALGRGREVAQTILMAIRNR